MLDKDNIVTDNVFSYMKAVSNKQSTIYDVAKMAGVSSATVSRVLNSPDMVAKEKREKVQEAINALNFVPKADAVANARASYKKIGVVAPFFTQPSFMERLRGVAQVLTSEHYELVIYSMDTEEDLENYVQMLVNTRRVDGLIMLCVKPEEKILTLLREAEFPVCFVECECEGFDSVLVQNLQGGQLAAEFLFSRGVKRPGFVGQYSSKEYTVSATEERFRGFSFYFANQGITIKKEHVWIGDFSEGTLDESLEKYLEQKDLPDAVFCSSDVIAARFIRVAQSKGIDVPEKIKVIGFDNIDVSEYLGLTSVSQSLEESGRVAARLVLERIAKKESAVVTARVPIEVIERETTGF